MSLPPVRTSLIFILAILLKSQPVVITPALSAPIIRLIVGAKITLVNLVITQHLTLASQLPLLKGLFLMVLL